MVPALVRGRSQAARATRDTEADQRDGEALVVMWLGDFLEWFADDGESRVYRAPG